ncbi:hypothetical protein OJ998_07735 [Solirubrobacter taibaiensis]|nr:hypothetical protein [Solirubrobacter taibaiensis]
MTSYYTLEPGAAVRAGDGTEIGKVEHVLADATDLDRSELNEKLRRAWEVISGKG